MNTKCPYCGSENVTVDCDIRVTGRLNPDGTVTVKNHWNLNELSIAINESSCDDLSGFCDDCGIYCDFSWEKGFYIEE